MELARPIMKGRTQKPAPFCIELLFHEATMNVETLRHLMDPVELRICLLCGSSKGIGYISCQNCRGQCPDRDCKGKGTKSWEYDQCFNCYQFLQSLPNRCYYVYLCDDGYVGMTSDPDARDAEHDEDWGRAIIWHTPPELNLDKFEAFRFEWALDYMGNVGMDGHQFLANRFKMITGLPPSHTAFQEQPPLYYG